SQTPSEGSATNDDPSGYLRHEVGHAVDDAKGMLSNQAGFVEAYNADILEMDQGTRDLFWEVMPDQNYATAQVFAELFSGLTAGSAPVREYTRQMIAHFPKTTRIMEAYLQRWKQ